jgi:hypothetical protein
LRAPRRSIFRLKNVADFVAKIRELENVGTRKRLIENGQKQRDKFRWQQSAATLAQLIKTPSTALREKR